MIEWITTNWVNILAIYGGLVGLCTAIVRMTPNTKDDDILAKIVKIVDVFSTAFTKSDKEKLDK